MPKRNMSRGKRSGTIIPPACNEHYLLHIMRGSPSFIPELDVVAVHGGRIVGNIVYAKSVIRTDDGKECEVLGMGPISVLPEYQRRGIGRQMIEHTKMRPVKWGSGPFCCTATRTTIHATGSWRGNAGHQNGG